MSEIFLTNKLKEILGGDSATSDSINISALLNKTNLKKSKQTVKHIDSITINNVNNDSATSSMVGGQNAQNNKIFSATSSEFFAKKKNTSETSAMNTNVNVNNLSATSADNFTSSLAPNQVMRGGKYSATSSAMVGLKKKNVSDMDHLVSMLTTESESSATENLENKLKSALKNNQAGGNGNMNVNNIKSFFANLKNDGVDVNIKLNDLSLSEFFNNKTEKAPQTMKESTVTESFAGGKRGMSDGFTAFRDLKNHVAKGLGLSGKDLITKASKIASAVKKEVEAKHPGKSSADVSRMGHKYFDENKDKFQKMCDKL